MELDSCRVHGLVRCVLLRCETLDGFEKLLIALQNVIYANLTKFAYGLFVFTQVTIDVLNFLLDRRVSFGLFFVYFEELV